MKDADRQLLFKVSHKQVHAEVYNDISPALKADRLAAWMVALWVAGKAASLVEKWVGEKVER